MNLAASLEGDDETQATELELAEEVAILYQQAMELIRNEFSERDWQAFRLVVLDERRPKEAAAILRVSANTVYLVKSRILRRLREEFEEVIGQPLKWGPSQRVFVTTPR